MKRDPLLLIHPAINEIRCCVVFDVLRIKGSLTLDPSCGDTVVYPMAVKCVRRNLDLVEPCCSLRLALQPSCRVVHPLLPPILRRYSIESSPALYRSLFPINECICRLCWKPSLPFPCSIPQASLFVRSLLS